MDKKNIKIYITLLISTFFCLTVSCAQQSSRTDIATKLYGNWKGVIKGFHNETTNEVEVAFDSQNFSLTKNIFVKNNVKKEIPSWKSKYRIFIFKTGDTILERQVNLSEKIKRKENSYFKLHIVSSNEIRLSIIFKQSDSSFLGLKLNKDGYYLKKM